MLMALVLPCAALVGSATAARARPETPVSFRACGDTSH